MFFKLIIIYLIDKWNMKFLSSNFWVLICNKNNTIKIWHFSKNSINLICVKKNSRKFLWVYYIYSVEEVFTLRKLSITWQHGIFVKDGMVVSRES